MLLKKLSISLITVVSLLCPSFQVFAADVILGGQSIGIELDYEGVMITGTYEISIDNHPYDPASDGFMSGDLITKVNHQDVESIQELMNEIKDCVEKKQEIILTLQRQKQTFEKELKFQTKDHQFTTGLYVQDGLTGIGTMTYYNPQNHHFGALGHMMCDTSLSSDISVKNGTIYHSYVKNIKPSQNGNPGEKIADIGSVEIGTLFDNNNYGIYGQYTNLSGKNQTISTASIDEVELGDAYFLTVLDGHTMSRCSIRITHLKKQSEPDIKGITFEITDNEVLSLTNGIVQGMSGSPIIQNNKLIGCVTHVDMNNVHQGYGLYIDWMLKNDK